MFLYLASITPLRLLSIFVLSAVATTERGPSHELTHRQNYSARHILFRAIVELILITPCKTLLYASIKPQSSHAGQQIFAEWFRVFHPRYDIKYL